MTTAHQSADNWPVYWLEWRTTTCDIRDKVYVWERERETKIEWKKRSPHVWDVIRDRWSRSSFPLISSTDSKCSFASNFNAHEIEWRRPTVDGFTADTYDTNMYHNGSAAVNTIITVALPPVCVWVRRILERKFGITADFIELNEHDDGDDHHPLAALCCANPAASVVAFNFIRAN